MTLGTGTDDIFDLVMRVADKEYRHVALAWITMGDINRIEQELVSKQFFMKCKLWLAWFDYAIKTYPTDKGLLYYWTEWQKTPPENNWYAHDVDVYGIHSFDSINNCLTWLGRKEATYEDCCLRMGELLMFGDSY